MKTVDLAVVEQPVEELLDLAEEEGVLIRLPNGKVFLLTSVSAQDEEAGEDFADEVARMRQNTALMELLRERAQDTERVSSEDVRRRLGV